MEDQESRSLGSEANSEKRLAKEEGGRSREN
jgi:hypothetical protein